MVRDIVSEIHLNEIIEKFNKLDKNNPDYAKNVNNIVEDYIDYVYKFIKNENIAVIVTVLDLLYNSFSFLLPRLLGKQDEIIIRAQLILEYLKGFDTTMIRDDYKNVSASNNYQILSNDHGISQKSVSLTNNSEKIYSILSNYLKDKTDNEINQIIKEDLIDFSKNMGEIHQSLISFDSTNFFPPRFAIINNLFKSKYLNEDILNNLYNEVMLKNKMLVSFDYSEIILNNPEIITKVKGLYRKCNSQFFDEMSKFKIRKSDFKEMDEFFRSIVDLNKNDTEGLRWFFVEFSKRFNINSNFRKFFEQRDYFIFYSKDVTKVLDDNLNKLLNNQNNIDNLMNKNLGSYKPFLDKYEILLEKFINSSDIDYQKKLIIPLIVGLIEKQREKYGLDFNLVFNSSIINNNILGYYNHAQKVMYINPNMFELSTDIKNSFVTAVNTVFHEIRHAIQFNEVETSNKFNYDNLIMAMDLYLAEDSISGYENDNYKYLSYEKDAREVAYVDTMDFFKKYPIMQETATKIYQEECIPSNYVRGKNILNSASYHGIIPMFMDAVNNTLKCAKNKKEFKDCQKQLEKYPVIKEFFDIDLKNKIISLKSSEYFINKFEKIKRLPDGLEKKEGLYTKNAFIYALSVSDYLSKKDIFTLGELINDDRYNSIMKEVVSNVGEAPSK